MRSVALAPRSIAALAAGEPVLLTLLVSHRASRSLTAGLIGTSQGQDMPHERLVVLPEASGHATSGALLYESHVANAVRRMDRTGGLTFHDPSRDASAEIVEAAGETRTVSVTSATANDRAPTHLVYDGATHTRSTVDSCSSRRFDRSPPTLAAVNLLGATARDLRDDHCDRVSQASDGADRRRSQ